MRTRTKPSRYVRRLVRRMHKLYPELDLKNDPRYLNCTYNTERSYCTYMFELIKKELNRQGQILKKDGLNRTRKLKLLTLKAKFDKERR